MIIFLIKYIMGKYSIFFDPDFDFADDSADAILIKSRENYEYKKDKKESRCYKYEEVTELFADTLANDMAKKLNIKYYPFYWGEISDEEFNKQYNYLNSYNEDEYLQFESIGYDQWPTACFTIDINDISKFIDNNFEILNSYCGKTYITDKSDSKFYYDLGFSHIKIYGNKPTIPRSKLIKTFHPKRKPISNGITEIDTDEKGNVIWI